MNPRTLIALATLATACGGCIVSNRPTKPLDLPGGSDVLTVRQLTDIVALLQARCTTTTGGTGR